MEYPVFAKQVKELRALREKTVYEVAEATGVSHTYISQIENGKKLPSIKVLFPFVQFLGKTDGENNFMQVNEIKMGSLELLKIYGEYKDISYDDLTDDYLKYVQDKVLFQAKEMNKVLAAWGQNKVKLDRNTERMEEVDAPYFDLKWMLNQKDFAVFYGKDYDIGNVLGSKKELYGKGKIDKNDVYNVLTDQDMKTIHDIIEAYISNKYRKLNKADFNMGGDD